MITTVERAQEQTGVNKRQKRQLCVRDRDSKRHRVNPRERKEQSRTIENTSHKDGQLRPKRKREKTRASVS